VGYVGKKNLKNFLDRSRGPIGRSVRTLLLAVLIGGCSRDVGERLQSGRVLAWHGLQGRWVGQVVPAERACGAATQGLMSIGKGVFAFDPFESTATVRGELGDNGHLNGRLIRQGADHQDLSISFAGVAEGTDAINGTLQSGRCRWMVTLHRG
jgi:hypothetical protein